MSKIIQITVKSAFSLALLGVAACNGIPGSESSDLPPNRPSTPVSGFVVDDAISGALINVYAFDGGVKGDLLGSTTTGANGAYSLEIDSINEQPVLIEARGGSYVELSTGFQVTLKDDEMLKAIDIFEPGQPLSLMVTPLTHLVVALVEFHLDEGVGVEEAIKTASSDINELFGFDVHSVYPRSIADQGSENGINDEHMYGFFLSALSSWTKRISEQNGLAPHETYNSVGLSQILFNELTSDGLMDGQAKINSTGELSDLALGVVSLDASSYRISFAQHMLAMAAGNKNITNIGVDDLLPRAVEFLNSQHPIFAGVETQLKGDQVDVTVEENLGNYRSGIFDFAATLGSPDLISSVSFSIDDVELPVVVVPGDMVVPIDSRQFSDGERKLTMVAKDWLGNTVANVSSTFKFDNTAPYVNLTSGLYTNKETYILSGELVNNGSELSQFEIEGQTISVAEDNTWSIELPLAPGKNSIDIVLIDAVGNKFGEDLEIIPDQTAPVIDASMGHGVARFLSANDQIIDGVLSDNNLSDPIYIETDKIDLNGAAITRTSLEQAQIPYFAFKTHDPVVDGVSSEVNALNVKMRYEKNATAVSDWRVLTSVEGEYFIPLVSETLHSTWHQSMPGDQHAVRIQVADKVGNVAEKLFVFKVAFVVNVFDVEEINELNKQLFVDAEFSNRANLYDMPFSALEYRYTNTSDEAIYISLEDPGGHKVEQNYEKLVREHKVRLITTPLWHVKAIINISDMCVGPVNRFEVENASKVFHYNGTSWDSVTAPPAVVGEVLDVFSDTPVAPDDSEKVDVNFSELFDDVIAHSEVLSEDVGVSTSTTSYDYDYRLNIQGVLQPIYVANWQRVIDFIDPNIEDKLISCESPPFFKKYTRYSYQSELGFPKDLLLTLHNQQDIDLVWYTVTNTTVNASISPVNGWYRIPAGHDVSITKNVHTPVLPVYDDDEVANSDAVATYTPQLYDKSISWSVNRAISLTAVHDVGEENILMMPSKKFSAGDGTVIYSMTR